MSRFYASIQGHRGEATRQGHREIVGHVRGWNLGVKVYCRVNPDTDKDVAEVYLTSGSQSTRSDTPIGYVYEQLGGAPPVLTLSDTPEMVEAARELLTRHEALEAS